MTSARWLDGRGGSKVKVLVVDDSAIVRKILSASLSKEADIEVIGTAPDPFVARDKILTLKPDVITLDIEMPRMDGITFLRKLMAYHPLPVVVISSLSGPGCKAGIEALRAGAVEIMGKPSGPYSVGELGDALASKIRIAASAKVVARRPIVTEVHGLREADGGLGEGPPPGESISPEVVYPRGMRPYELIAIGASTGGVEAIGRVLSTLPAQIPPILITQHMPPLFTAQFAERLNACCSFAVKEAANGDEVVPGRVLIAPGDFHMRLVRTQDGMQVQLDQGPAVCYQRPAVDVMFSSVAQESPGGALGILLTGMGADGARGLLAMRRSGSRTIAQEEGSCVVFGMPREAIRAGAAENILPLDSMARAIMAGQANRSRTEPGAPIERRGSER
jgi:two-component system, chemotaxis family, protein-glutamate methylesterase/glutaminase